MSSRPHVVRGMLALPILQSLPLRLSPQIAIGHLSSLPYIPGVRYLGFYGPRCIARARSQALIFHLSRPYRHNFLPSPFSFRTCCLQIAS